MKKINEDKKSKEPILIVSACIGVIIGILCLAIVADGVTGFMYSMTIGQLTLFAVAMLIVVISTAAQFIICEGLVKDNIGKSIVVVIIMLVTIAVICSSNLAFVVKDNIHPIAAYALCWLVSIISSTAITYGLVRVSTFLAVSIYGYTSCNE